MLDALARSLVRTAAHEASRAGVFLLLLACASPTAAQTDDPVFAGYRWAPPVVGSRPAGMGGAFVGMADSVKAAVVNPAGLTLIPITEISLSSGPYWAGVGVGRPGIRLAGYYTEYDDVHTDLGDVAPGRSGFLDSNTREAGLAVGVSLTPRLKLGGSIATMRLRMDGERRVPGPEGNELTAARVTADETQWRGSAGLLLVLVGANTRALPSLRLGVSWQPGYDSDAQITEETDGNPRTIALRRPTLVSTGLAWRASDRWSVVAQGDVILYGEVMGSLERNIGEEAALDFSLPSTVEPRFGAEFAAPLWCGCGSVRFRGGLHYRSPGTLRYVGSDLILRRTFAPESWRTVASLGASFFTEHYGNALRLDFDVRDVFEGPNFSFGVVWRF